MKTLNCEFSKHHSSLGLICNVDIWLIPPDLHHLVAAAELLEIINKILKFLRTGLLSKQATVYSER